MSSSARKAQVDQHLRDLGDRLRVLRGVAGLTQEQLAEIVGVHRAEIGFFERGERDFGVSKLWPLAKALRVTVAELFEAQH